MRKYLLFNAGVLLLLASGCKAPAPAVLDAPPYRPTSTIRDIMATMVDPTADYVWDSVATIIDESGTTEKRPRTPKEWAELRRNTVTLLEASNLLIMPGRMVAKPGEVSANPGIELSPEEVSALIEKSRPDFVKLALALNDTVVEVLKAVDAKDADGVLDKGAAIDGACENCHKIYWYPNEFKNEGAPPAEPAK